MANTTKTHREETSVLGRMLRPSLPLDTDGLPGLQGAPVVYDLILRDLQEDQVTKDGHPAPKTDQDQQDDALKRGHRPG